MPWEKGLVHVYTGEGKGKTTAAVGLAVRARGAGRNVAFFQFMKGTPSGEVPMLGLLGVDVTRAGRKSKFVSQMDADEREDYRRIQGELFHQAALSAGGYDIMVLDEILGAVGAGMVEETAVVRFLDEKPHALEVVMTGRNPAAELARRADYITEMRCERHPYDKGVSARAGIEF